MSTFITPNRYAQTLTIPISLPQTELRRGSTVNIGSFALLSGQRAEVRSLNLSIVRLFTPGVNVSKINTPFGLASVGIYDSNQMLCSPVIGVHAHALGTSALNPYIRNVLTAPCLYRVIVSNNTGLTFDTALDFAVTVAGSVKVMTNTDPSQAASTISLGTPVSVVTATPTNVESTTADSDDSSQVSSGGCPAIWQWMFTKESGWIEAGAIKPGMHLRGLKTEWTEVYGIRIIEAPIWRCVINNTDVFDVDSNHAWLMADDTWKSIKNLKTGDKVKSNKGVAAITALYFLKRGKYAHLTVEGQHYAMNAYYAHNATGSTLVVFKF